MIIIMITIQAFFSVRVNINDSHIIVVKLGSKS